MVDLGSLEPTTTIAVQGQPYTYRECIAQMKRNISACKQARQKSRRALKDRDTETTEAFRQMADVCEQDANVWKQRAAELQGE